MFLHEKFISHLIINIKLPIYVRCHLLVKKKCRLQELIFDNIRNFYDKKIRKLNKFI